MPQMMMPVQPKSTYVPPLLPSIKARGVAPDEPEPKAAKNEIKIPPAPKVTPSIRIPSPEEVGLGKK